MPIKLVPGSETGKRRISPKRKGGYIMTSFRRSTMELIDIMFTQTVEKEQIISQELLDAMFNITNVEKREIAVFISRKGEIIDVAIGDASSVKLKEYREKRSLKGLSGIRCIHTHPNGKGYPSDMDVSALKILKLDLMVSIGIDNREIKDSFIAYINEEEKSGVVIQGPYKPSDLLEINFSELIREIEKIFEASDYDHALTNIKEEKAILVGIKGIEDLDELSELLKTAGGIEAGRLVQNITRIDSAFFLGKGKLKELAGEVQVNDADFVVFDDELSGAQIRNIENELNVKIIDRTQIILDIFAKRASSKEGKLQVELAQLKYALPRLVGQGITMSRTGGGIGTRGPGEQKLETDRRRIREKISELEKEIKEIKKNRQVQRKSRKNLFNVCIVGYTNSGKSTLLNALTDSDAFVEDLLFATLDPTSRKLQLKEGNEIVITDTVGFIRNLPHGLIEAFKSTLEEVTYADLLLHVVDGSIDYFEKQIEIVNEVLKDLNAENKPVILVFNKIDKKEENLFFPFLNKYKDIIYISAKERINLNRLMDMIVEKSKKDHEIVELLIPYNQSDIITYLYENGRVINKEYRDKYIFVRCEMSSAAAGKVKKYYNSALIENSYRDDFE